MSVELPDGWDVKRVVRYSRYLRVHLDSVRYAAHGVEDSLSGVLGRMPTLENTPNGIQWREYAAFVDNVRRAKALVESSDHSKLKSFFVCNSSGGANDICRCGPHFAVSAHQLGVELLRNALFRCDLIENEIHSDLWTNGHKTVERGFEFGLEIADLSNMDNFIQAAKTVKNWDLLSSAVCSEAKVLIERELILCLGSLPVDARVTNENDSIDWSKYIAPKKWRRLLKEIGIHISENSWPEFKQRYEYQDSPTSGPKSVRFPLDVVESWGLKIDDPEINPTLPTE